MTRVCSYCFSQLDVVFRVFYGAFLQPFQAVLGWKRIRRCPIDAFGQSLKLAKLVHGELERISMQKWALSPEGQRCLTDREGRSAPQETGQEMPELVQQGDVAAYCSDDDEEEEEEEEDYMATLAAAAAAAAAAAPALPALTMRCLRWSTIKV